MDYFPFHIWDVIRNPLTMVIAPPFWDDPTCCCCSQGKCQIGAALSHWERARVNAGLFVEENSGVPWQSNLLGMNTIQVFIIFFHDFIYVMVVLKTARLAAVFMGLVMEASAPDQTSMINLVGWKWSSTFNMPHLVINMKCQHPEFQGQVHTSTIPYNLIRMILGNPECWRSVLQPPFPKVPHMSGWLSNGCTHSNSKLGD